MNNATHWFLIALIVAVVIPLSTATLWVDDPEDCGTEYQSQTCANPGEVVCGYSGGVTYCYDNASIVPPGTTGYSTTSYSGSFDGGYIFDCHSYNAPEPYCTPASCDRASACYNVNRITNCTADTFSTYVCGSCRSGYQACDGSIIDADGCEVDYGTTSYPGEANAHYASDQSCDPECNSGYLDCNSDLGTSGDGCEVLDGSSCDVAGLPGTVNGCDGGVANCELDNVDIATSGIQANWSSSSNPFLWLRMFGSAPVINATTASNGSFIVNNSGAYWNGTDLSFSGSSGGNTTEEIVTAANTTGYLINWSDEISFTDTNLTGSSSINPTIVGTYPNIGVENNSITLTEANITDLGSYLETESDPVWTSAFPDWINWTSGGDDLLNKSSDSYVETESDPVLASTYLEFYNVSTNSTVQGNLTINANLTITNGAQNAQFYFNSNGDFVIEVN